MKKVYVCSPLRGNNFSQHNMQKNIAKARLYCRDVLDKGHIPIAPHVYLTQFMDDTIAEEREHAKKINVQLLDLCDELWIYGKEISEGMHEEIDYAIKNKKKLVFKGDRL